MLKGVVLLSQSSAAVVTATLPAVQAHGEAITSRFYQRMFKAHPELLNIFNKGHQATGEQPAALAASVVAYAEHLIDGGDEKSWELILSRIAHKHASLGITATQYTIVGRHLLAAVGEVLGAAVTDEVAAAWDEVYWLLACELIAREARLYTQAGVGEDGSVWRHWQVVECIQETADVISFRLVPADGGPLPTFTPGQYVSVAVDLDGGGQQIRQYSLSGRPGEAYWQITVKRVRATGDAPEGVVSTLLHDRVTAGDTLRLSPPFGEVSAVGDGGPLVLVSAGIGLTPAMSALHHLAATETDREVVLVHADRSAAAHARRHELPDLAEQLPNLSVLLWYEDAAAGELDRLKAEVTAGQLDPSRVPLPAEADIHLCGPVPFMYQVRAELLRRGVPKDRIGYDVFGPGMLRD